MHPRQIDALLTRLTTTSHRYVSRKGFKGNEKYLINPDGLDAAKLIEELLSDRQRLIDERDEWRTKARERAGEIALFSSGFTEAMHALRAAHFYIDASDDELVTAGLTREQALDHARDMLTIGRSPFMNVLFEGPDTEE
jgi:hypothetical protein